MRISRFRLAIAALATLLAATPLARADFSAYADLTVAGYDANRLALANFPVLVRISETGISGFSYSQLQSDGKDLAFTSTDGGTTYLPARIRVTQVARPAGAALIGDTALEWSAGLTVYPYYLTPRQAVAAVGGGSWSATQQFRHNRRSNVAWVDGHVSAEAPGELNATAFAMQENVGWLGTDDRAYCLTREDYAELGIELGK